MALSDTWFLDGYIDFELQKYKLLAYLKEVNQHFDATRLYPQLGDLIAHYRNLENFRKNKQLLQEQFPKELSKIETKPPELVYKQLLGDDDTMAELELITDYAADMMKTTIDNGAGIYEHVEKRLSIEPVGIIPLYKNEGYLLLHYNQDNIVRAYNYAISMLQHSNTNYTAVSLNYIDSFAKNISVTYNNIKTQLLRAIRTLPNPAVYLVESELAVPLNETLLPIARRALVRYIGIA